MPNLAVHRDLRGGWAVYKGGRKIEPGGLTLEAAQRLAERLEKDAKEAKRGND